MHVALVCFLMRTSSNTPDHVQISQHKLIPAAPGLVFECYTPRSVIQQRLALRAGILVCGVEIYAYMNTFELSRPSRLVILRVWRLLKSSRQLARVMFLSTMDLDTETTFLFVVGFLVHHSTADGRQLY